MNIAAAILLTAVLSTDAKEFKPHPTPKGETPEAIGQAIAELGDRWNIGYRGESADMEMTLTNAHGDEVKRKMISKILEVKGDGDKSIIEFQWPADVKGTRMLTWTHKKKDDDQWLYLPAIKRVKRISSRNKSGAFMGSEFAYEDLGSQEPEKFTHKFIKETTNEERPAWLIERVPTYRSGYTKQRLWVDRVYLWPTKVEYFDRKGELLKTSHFTNFENYGKYWRAGAINIENHQTRKKSTLTWSKRKIPAPHPKGDFDKENLED
ncbi:MAG: outer membrane lipoprotein-sorting protein [Elusimicrobia bacterium]|nr:MAG: outer membrane lipoprotein-sorting protein [Elusimicrobiota bacterium]